MGEVQPRLTFPGVGRNRDEIEPGYRSIAEGEYVIFYRVKSDDVVEILRIVHGKRDLVLCTCKSSSQSDERLDVALTAPSLQADSHFKFLVLCLCMGEFTIDEKTSTSHGKICDLQEQAERLASLNEVAPVSLLICVCSRNNA